MPVPVSTAAGVAGPVWGAVVGPAMGVEAAAVVLGELGATRVSLVLLHALLAGAQCVDHGLQDLQAAGLGEEGWRGGQGRSQVGTGMAPRWAFMPCTYPGQGNRDQVRQARRCASRAAAEAVSASMHLGGRGGGSCLGVGQLLGGRARAAAGEPPQLSTVRTTWRQSSEAAGRRGPQE